MKNHEMMIRDIHRKMDAYNLKNEKRKEMTQKITKLTVPVCAAAFIGVGLLYKGIVSPEQVPTAKSSLNEQTELSSAAQNTDASGQSLSGTSDAVSEHQNPETFGRFIAGACIYRNSMEYYAEERVDESRYTIDRYLGKVSDFEGIYDDTEYRLISAEDSVYTVKETDDVLFAVKPDGSIVAMITGRWTPEKYAPETLDPDYVDPTTSTGVIF